VAYALLRAASALMPTLYHRHSCLCSGVSTFGGRVTQVGRLIACPLWLRPCCSVGQPILAAAAFQAALLGRVFALGQRRLKAGGNQDSRPHAFVIEIQKEQDIGKASKQ
jgi:hypothetical protein